MINDNKLMMNEKNISNLSTMYKTSKNNKLIHINSNFNKTTFNLISTKENSKKLIIDVEKNNKKDIRVKKIDIKGLNLLDNNTESKKNKTLSETLRLKDVSNMEFIDLKLQPTKILKNLKNNPKLKNEPKYDFPNWRKLILKDEDEKVEETLNKMLFSNKSNSVRKSLFFDNVNKSEKINSAIKNNRKKKLKEATFRLGKEIISKTCKVDLDDSTLVKNSISNISSISDNSRKKVSFKDAAKQVELPNKKVYFKDNNSENLNYIDEKALIARMTKISNSNVKDTKILNRVKEKRISAIDRKVIEDEQLIKFDKELESRFKAIKKKSTFLRGKNKLSIFNDYLIRNFVFGENSQFKQESQKKWNFCEDFFKELVKTRKNLITKTLQTDQEQMNKAVNEFHENEESDSQNVSFNEIVKKNSIFSKNLPIDLMNKTDEIKKVILESKNTKINNNKDRYEKFKKSYKKDFKFENGELIMLNDNITNNTNNDLERLVPIVVKNKKDTYNFIKLDEANHKNICDFGLTNSSKIIKQQLSLYEAKKGVNRVIENNRLIEKLLDDKSEYENLNNTCMNNIISDKNLFKIINRRNIERSFLREERKIANNPDNVTVLKKQQLENIELQYNVLKNISYAPNFVKKKLRSKTYVKYNLINGSNFSKKKN